MKSKFLDIIVNTRAITVNADNIASFEQIGSGVKIILNITDSEGKFIVYESLVGMTVTNNPLFIGN